MKVKKDGVFMGLVGFILLAIGVYCGVVGFEELKAKLPEPLVMSLGVSLNSEIVSKSQIVPGTFKIFKTEEEILEKAKVAPEKLTVAWDERGVDYWYPKEGTAAFYYASKRPEPKWGSPFVIGQAEKKINDIIFYPVRNIAGIGFLFLFSFLLGLAGLLLFGRLFCPSGDHVEKPKE